MHVSIGTFNVNNLFSRYNFAFEAEVLGLPVGKVEMTKISTIVENAAQKSIEYKGSAVHHKDPADRKKLAERIKTLNLDILAVQEVEDIDTLQFFAQQDLGGLYPYLMLIEGNDKRLIDVAIMSKYPIGPATTWQTATHPNIPGQRIFSRDLLQAQILSKDGKRILFTVFTTHLKSKFVPFTEDPVTGTQASNQRRRLQAETAAEIILASTRPSSPYILLGDLNDDISSELLTPLSANLKLNLVNGLTHAKETRPSPKTSAVPTTPLWTHRYKPTGMPAQYELLDQIWLSPSLGPKLQGAFIDRRTKLGGDGSDHDPAWIVVDV